MILGVQADQCSRPPEQVVYATRRLILIRSGAQRLLAFRQILAGLR